MVEHTTLSEISCYGSYQYDNVETQSFTLHSRSLKLSELIKNSQVQIADTLHMYTVKPVLSKRPRDNPKSLA